jgi:hypothetical protein
MKIRFNHWEKGSALVMVMMYAMILTILGTAMLGVVINEYRMEKAHRESIKAFYLAEAGIEKAIYEISQLGIIDPETLMGMTFTLDDAQEDLLKPGEQGGFTVRVSTKEGEGVKLVDTIYFDEENQVVYKYIYEITLEGVGFMGEREDAKGAIKRKIQAVLKFEDYAIPTIDNKAEIISWRQL